MPKDHFDHIAGHYDESLPAHVVEHYLAKRTRFLAEWCPPPARALDVGCGTGVLAARLAAAGYDVVGVDPSEGMLAVMAERSPAVAARRGTGEELPFGDAEFDLSFCVAVLHHVADAELVRRTLAEMARVTRHGGTVMVWDHNPRNPYWPYLMSRVPQDTGDERLIPLPEIVNGLAAGGGRPVLVRQLGLVPDFTPPRLLRAAAGLERAVEHTPLIRRLGAHNVVVARRV